MTQVFNNTIDRLDGYRGSAKIKRPGQSIAWTEELLIEFQRCKEDPLYFAEHYMKVVHVDRGLETITLYDYQKEIITSCHENRFTVAECARQSGKTTAVTAFILHYIIFNDYKNVAILANKGETAREILGRIQLAYEFLPDWLQQGVVEWNKGTMVLENGSEIRAGSTTSNNIRGFSINFLFIDEAAFIDGWDAFFTSVFPTISSGETTKLLLVSTVNGLNHFHKITSLARKKGTPEWNGYNIITVKWQDVPGRDEKWHQTVLRGMNFDYEKFSQEFENEYLGSSGTLISGSKLKELVADITLPSIGQHGISLYKKAEKDHSYILIADVSRGKGLDYSAFQIIDITKMPYEQVLTFRDNMITPGDYAEVINRFGRLYNSCPVLVEINDIGEEVSNLLWNDFEYENILLTENAGPKGKQVSTIYKPNSDRGVRTTKTVKNVGCSMLKLLVEQDQLIIRDHETIQELSTFSRKGNSYEAESGKTDDLVMCLVLFSWLSKQDYFKEITDINTLMKLREKTEEEMDQNMVPFGVSTNYDSDHDLEAALELHNMKDELWVLA